MSTIKNFYRYTRHKPLSVIMKLKASNKKVLKRVLVHLRARYGLSNAVYNFKGVLPGVKVTYTSLKPDGVARKTGFTRSVRMPNGPKPLQYTKPVVLEKSNKRGEKLYFGHYKDQPRLVLLKLYKRKKPIYRRAV